MAVTFLPALSGCVMSYTAVRSQKAVSAYLQSKQILPFGFARKDITPSGTGRVYLPLCKVGNIPFHFHRTLCGFQERMFIMSVYTKKVDVDLVMV